MFCIHVFSFRLFGVEALSTSSDLALRKANIPVEGLFVLDLFFVDVVEPFDVAGQFSLNFLLV